MVTKADAIVRKAMAQLRFEIGMMSLGESKPADLSLPATCPQKSGCFDKGLPPTYVHIICPFIDLTWCQSPDSSVVWPRNHLRYDLHTLCPRKCGCTSCSEDSLVCPSKEHAKSKGKTVWYIHAINYRNLAAIQPASVKGVAGNQVFFSSGPRGSNTQVSILETVSVSPGTSLEIKYKYLVAPDKTGTCSKDGPLFYVYVGTTRIGAQQGPFTDYPLSRCRNPDGSVENGCRKCWSPLQTLIIKINRQLSGRLDLHFKNNARYLLLRPVSVITIGPPPPGPKANISLFVEPT